MESFKDNLNTHTHTEITNMFMLCVFYYTILCPPQQFQTKFIDL